MICRLCLDNITSKLGAQILDTDINNTQAVIFKIIDKYLNVNILYDDLLMENICEDCYNKLIQFENWLLYIQQKHSTLRNEFIEIKCGHDTNFCNKIDKNYEEKDKDNSFSNNKLIEKCLDPVKGLVCPKTEKNFCDDSNDIKSNVAVHDEEDNKHLLSDKILANINNPSIESKYLKEDNCICPISSNNINGHEFFSDYGDDEKPLSYFGFDKETKVSTKAKEKNYKASKSKIRIKNVCVKSSDQKQSKIEIIQNFMELCCDICNCNIDSYNNLCTHFNAVHQMPAYVKCCNKSYKKVNRLIEHIEWHQNPDKFKCYICNKLMSSKSYLEMHINSHNSSSQPKKKCNICNKEYRGNKCLKNHDQSDEKKINCDLCNKCFMTPQRLRRHIDSIHDNVCPYVCDICGKKYKFKPSFERHMQEHQGIIEPPERCDICNEWLKNKHSLRLHRFKHIEVDIDCKICGRKCPSRTALIRHINYAHKLKKNLSCNYCDKTFKVEKNLKEHMAIHTGLQLYSCPHCLKECRSKSNMYVHIKRVHFEEWLKSKKAKSNDPNVKEV